MTRYQDQAGAWKLKIDLILVPSWHEHVKNRAKHQYQGSMIFFLKDPIPGAVGMFKGWYPHNTGFDRWYILGG
jgi:gentisate 1,2-dioxygenase